MFHHSLNIIRVFNVILVHYVFKLTGLRSKGRPKIRPLFRHFVNLKKNIF